MNQMKEATAMYEEMKRLYVQEGYSLRQIADTFGTNHHFVKRRLVEAGVDVSKGNWKHKPHSSGYKRKPFSAEHRRKLSESSKGRPCVWKGKKMPKASLYKNMLNHIRWDVSLDYLQQFNDIERLKALNKLLSRDRVAVHFDTDKYKQFIDRFYYDESFNKQFDVFQSTGNKYDRPSIDHIIPLSRGGTWDLENLQIISWFENRCKCDMTPDEYNDMVRKYFLTSTP